MSYNVLSSYMGADAGVHKHAADNERLLAFDFRGPRIIQEIRESSSVIVAFQELDEINTFYDGELRKLGFTLIRYNEEEIKVDTDTHKHIKHEIAIAYKTEEFSVLDVKKIDFNELVAIHGDKDYKRNN